MITIIRKWSFIVMVLCLIAVSIVAVVLQPTDGVPAIMWPFIVLGTLSFIILFVFPNPPKQREK